VSARASLSARLGSQSALILLGNVITLLVGLPLQVFVSRKLGADGLGVFGLIESGIGIVAGLMAFGAAPALVRFIPAYLEQGRYNGVRALVGKGAKLLLLAGVSSYIALLAALPLVTAMWPALDGWRTEIVWMGLLIPVGLFAFYFQQGLRALQEIFQIVLASSFLQVFAKAALAVLLLSLGFGLLGYVIATVLSIGCACVWTGTVLWRKLRAIGPSADDGDAESASWRRYAAIQYGGSVLGLATQYLDRFLLGAFIGATPVGILMVVRQLQQMPVVFLQMLIAAAAPMFSAAHARGDRAELQHIYHLTTDWVVRLSAPLFVFFLFFADPVLLLYGKDFVVEGKPVLWLLLGSQAVNLLTGPVGNALNMTGSERLLLRFDFLGTVFSAAGLALLVPRYGLIGAAAVMAANNVLQNLAMLVAARRRLGLVWSDRRYVAWVLPLAVTLAVAGAALWYGPPAPGPAWLIAYVVMFYAVFHAVSLAQGLHADDKSLLAHLGGKLGLTG
jgi:O-antigen/teichoic acid export membrane protein